MISIPLLLSEDHQCSYLSGETAKTAFVHPAFPVDNKLYSRLIEQGYRRSGDEVYAPFCKNCQKCISVRIPVNDFIPNRRQRRCRKKNQHTQAFIRPAGFQQNHYALYVKYQQSRHHGGLMAESTPEEYINFLRADWSTTMFVEFYIEQTLIAVAVVDVLENGLSAVYTFFDPDFSHFSPGMYGILWQLEHARSAALDYLYLGYWIEECQKMSYKNQYQPLFGFFDHQWQQIGI